MSGTGQAYNRRRHRRFQICGTVIFKHAGTDYKAIIKNISMGGLCASLRQLLPPGDELALDIPLPGSDVVVVRAEVVRSYIGGAAMRFHWLGEDDRSRLLLQEVLDR